MEIEFRTILTIIPEIALIVAAVSVIVGGAFVRSSTGWISFCVITIAGAAVLLFRQLGPPGFYVDYLQTGPLAMDALAGTIRWMALEFGLLFVLMMARAASADGGGELLGMLLLAVAGVMLSASAADVITLFLALELISIPTYVLLFLGRGGARAAEATAKYFFLSILSSGFFLMGLALLFGLTGAIRLDEIGASTAGLAASQAVRPALLALVLIVAALSFKITAVPFHYYAPDVYLATSNLNAGLLSVIPKVAGLVALVRLTALLAPVFPDFGWQLIVIISILTMTIGNLGALLQKNMRRLMAYSSIAHAGYMLIGVAVGLYGADQTLAYGGFSAAFLYLFVYAVASIGAFAALTEVETGEGTSADQVGKAETGAVTELAGLSRQRPWMAAAIGICMFSLAGLPPLAGFWGKLALFSSALTAYRSGAGNNWFLILAVVGVLNAAVAAAYYLRVISVIYFEEGIVPSRRQVSIPSVAAVIGGLAVVVIGLFPGNLVESFRRVGPSPIIASQDMLDDSMLDDAQRSARTSAHLTAKP